MKPYQFIGYALNNTSAITNITSTRIYHGLRPEGTSVPAINYFELSGDRMYGIESQSFSINCRASTAASARTLAGEVIKLFHGTSYTGIYGTLNNFDIARCSLRNDNGLIPETEDNIFNSPVDIQIVYSANTIT